MIIRLKIQILDGLPHSGAEIHCTKRRGLYNDSVRVLRQLSKIIMMNILRRNSVFSKEWFVVRYAETS